MTPEPINTFNMVTYERIIQHALDRSYKFVTLNEFINLGCPGQQHFILRHDIDRSPTTLSPIIEVERYFRVHSTAYVRIAGAEYNPFGYSSMKVLREAVNSGTEIGLHTACFEYGQLTGHDPLQVLRGELAILREFFDVKGIAPHRDINYTYNSLPFIEQEWSNITKLGIQYHAYEQRIIEATTYVNEGFNPHLCWRSLTPFEAMNGKSIYMLTHPHWWFRVHPFEAS